MSQIPLTQRTPEESSALSWQQNIASSITKQLITLVMLSLNGLICGFLLAPWLWPLTVFVSQSPLVHKEGPEHCVSPGSSHLRCRSLQSRCCNHQSLCPLLLHALSLASTGSGGRQEFVAMSCVAQSLSRCEICAANTPLLGR